MSERILPFPKLEIQRLDRFTWLKAVLSGSGPTGSSARLVASVLSMRMRSDLTGETFPSQDTIAVESGLSVRTVRVALHALESQGWLQITKTRAPNQQWAKSLYVPRIPASPHRTLTEPSPNPHRTVKENDSNDGQALDKSLNGIGESHRQNLPVTPSNASPLHGNDRQLTTGQPAESAATTGNIRRSYRQNLPTNLLSNSTPRDLINNSLSESDILLREKEKAEEKRKAEEVLREERRRKIQKAADFLGASVMPTSSESLKVWTMHVGRMTQLTPDEVLSAVGVTQS